MKFINYKSMAIVFGWTVLGTMGVEAKCSKEQVKKMVIERNNAVKGQSAHDLKIAVGEPNDQGQIFAYQSYNWASNFGRGGTQFTLIQTYIGYQIFDAETCELVDGKFEVVR